MSSQRHGAQALLDDPSLHKKVYETYEEVKQKAGATGSICSLTSNEAAPESSYVYATTLRALGQATVYNVYLACNEKAGNDPWCRPLPLASAYRAALWLGKNEMIDVVGYEKARNGSDTPVYALTAKGEEALEDQLTRHLALAAMAFSGDPRSG